MRLGYVEEKLTAVVLGLSQSEGSLQENLANCAIFLLQLKPEDFPSELRETFTFIKEGYGGRWYDDACNVTQRCIAISRRGYQSVQGNNSRAGPAR